MAWDENHDELYVAITHVGASTTQPHTDRTNWRPVGLVPYTTQPNLSLQSGADGFPGWKTAEGPVGGYIRTNAVGKYGIDWPKVAQTSGFDPANATTLAGPWVSNQGIAGVGAGEWGYNGGRLIISETANGATFPTKDIIIGSIIRISDPSDATRYTDFIVTDAPRVLDTPTGKLVAIRAPQHGSGPGGNTIAWDNSAKPTSTSPGNNVQMLVDIAPPAFIPDAMWVVAEDTVVPANVPGIGGMPAHKGDIVQMIDTDGDALVDSYQILSSGHSVWEQLSTQALDPNAKIGDVFFNIDTHAIGTIIDDTANPGTLIRGPVLDEPMIRQWITESSLFEGTVGDIGTTLAHTPATTRSPADATNKGHTYIAAEAFTTVATGPIPAGWQVEPGDSIISDGTNWEIIAGGGLTQQQADGSICAGFRTSRTSSRSRRPTVRCSPPRMPVRRGPRRVAGLPDRSGDGDQRRHPRRDRRQHAILRAARRHPRTRRDLRQHGRHEVVDVVRAHLCRSSVGRTWQCGWRRRGTHRRFPGREHRRDDPARLDEVPRVRHQHRNRRQPAGHVASVGDVAEVPGHADLVRGHDQQVPHRHASQRRRPPVRPAGR